ncbi:MAG: proton-conducting transporter membrane subunit [Pirellulales bacterium]
MMPVDTLLHYLGLTVVTLPALLVLLLGATTLANRPFAERVVGELVKYTSVVGFIAALAILGIMLATGKRNVPIELGHWVEIPHFHFVFRLAFDRLSVPFVVLSFVLCGTIGAFAVRYMHREEGYQRFFVLYSIFLLGILVTSLASTIETLFAGWELVGLSSALLVAFYHQRPGPVRNGLWVWAVYRISDAALLLAAIALHHLSGEGDFRHVMGTDPWPGGTTELLKSQALLVGLLLLVAAAGKSALIPFCGWLPRAMEGPTPSSAVFYGSLSVHLGAYLLLRASPLLDHSWPLSAAVFLVGTISALIAAFMSRAQTDIKSALSFASLTQVGIIVAEIGLGFRYVALIHLLGHACLRTLQFVRAPTLLLDYNVMENAIGMRLSNDANGHSGRPASGWRGWTYRLAMERGYLDGLLSRCLAEPLLNLFRLCERVETGWTEWLSGRPLAESESPGPNRPQDMPPRDNAGPPPAAPIRQTAASQLALTVPAAEIRS